MYKPYQHCVHGVWMTEREAAEKLGVNLNTLKKFRVRHRRANGAMALLEEAWDWYSARRAGEKPVWPSMRRQGRPPVKHRVNGRRMTQREAAETYGVTLPAIWMQMNRHHCSVEEAVDRARSAKAEREILAVVREVGRK